MNSLLRRRFTSFWTLNSIAWLAYGVVSFAGALPYVGLSSHLDSVRSLFVNRAAFAIVGFLSSGLLRVFVQREIDRQRSLLRAAVRALPLAFVAGLACTALANLARLASGGHLVEGWAGLFAGSVTAFAVFLCWCACYFAVHAYHEMQAEQQNALQARATAQEAQWTALRGQLNPHFLFNSLNSIQALIQESPAQAQQAVGQLAALLRYSLRQNNGTTVPLQEEIDILRKYLAIESTRFEDNLLVRVEVQPETAQLPVPGFLLHPLVENAVRYGMQTSAMPLQIRIRAFVRNDALCLEVANTGRWLAVDESELMHDRSGIGLRIVREHLEQSYPGRHQSSCFTDGGWVVQRIEIAELAGLVGKDQHALSCAAAG
jgi:two-component sensor histidine kinase